VSILVTGVAGFIGSHMAHRLLTEGHTVTGIDCLTPYYDVSLKRARLSRLLGFTSFRHEAIDLCDMAALEATFAACRPRTVIHLAAQPGVRYSLDHPQAYVQSNIVGFANLLEACRRHPPEHLIFASSSSVYGANRHLPYDENQVTDHPLSIYAATKKANEVTAHSYSHLFNLATTGLRFFTAYGEWGRPDMSFFTFTRAILAGEPINLFNRGQMSRDFTYIADVVECMVRLIDRPPAPSPDWNPEAPEPATSGVAPYRIYNVGNSQPVELIRYIRTLEDCLGKPARINLVDAQPGEVRDTWASVDALADLIEFTPRTPLETGIANFVRWYREYYRV